MNGLCGKCGKALDRPKGQRYCLACHAEYARRNRPRYSELDDEQRRRINARSYAKTYQQRGKLVPQPCADCGVVQVEKHHEDYSRPLDVQWLCRPCHLKRHRRSA